MKIASTLVILFAVVGSPHAFAVNPNPNNMTQQEILEELWRRKLAEPPPPRAEVEKFLQGYCPDIMKDKTKAEALITVWQRAEVIDMKDEGYVEECNLEDEGRENEGLQK